MRLRPVPVSRPAQAPPPKPAGPRQATYRRSSSYYYDAASLLPLMRFLRESLPSRLFPQVGEMGIKVPEGSRGLGSVGIKRCGRIHALVGVEQPHRAVGTRVRVEIGLG